MSKPINKEFHEQKQKEFKNATITATQAAVEKLKSVM